MGEIFFLQVLGKSHIDWFGVYIKRSIEKFANYVYGEFFETPHEWKTHHWNPHILNVPIHLYWRCLCLSAVGFKQKTALMAELVTKSKIY